MTAKLDWWWSDDRTRYWANSPHGQYVVTLNGDHWNVAVVSWGRATRWRQLGTAATAQEAKALAQADYDLRGPAVACSFSR